MQRRRRSSHTGSTANGPSPFKSAFNSAMNGYLKATESLADRVNKMVPSKPRSRNTSPRRHRP